MLRTRVVAMTNMQVVVCVAVVSVVVCGVTRAALVPYTLGKTTIMVDSEVLGYNSPLLAYLKQGMPLRRDGESHADNILEDAGQSQEETYEEMPTTVTQESDESYSFNKDFHTSPEGDLAIKVMPGRRPPPITMDEATGIYFKGQLVPIPHEDTTPPLYYNVQTPNFAQVSEKIHNIVTSLSPKLNDRAPDPSRPPPIPNALPLQLHARPGDTPPSLANTEGFTGVSVKHMVPEESDEDQATNNEDLDFLLSNDPEAVHHLLQSDIHDIHAKPPGHDSISPMGHIWGPAIDSPQHTRVHDAEEIESNDQHTSLFDVNVEPPHHKLNPSSDTQQDGDELDSTVDEVSTTDTVTTLPIAVTQVSLHSTQSALPTLVPEVVDMIANEEVNTITTPASETESVSRQAEGMDTTDKEHAAISPTKESVALTEELGTTIHPMKKVNTAIPVGEVETVTPSVEEVETVFYMTETDIMPTEEYADIDLDQIVSIKIEELQRDEVRESVLLAEEEEDQVALDDAMVNLFENLFGSVTDSPYNDSEDNISMSLVSTNSTDSDSLRPGEGDEQNVEERLNNTLKTDDNADMDSAIEINEDSHIDSGDFPAFPTITFHTSEEQRPSPSYGDDSLMPFSDFYEEVVFADQRTETASSSNEFPAQGQLHYSVDANPLSPGNNPEQQSSTQQDISLKHDLPHSADEGLKSWFSREPIIIFDPLHSPNPASSLPDGPHKTQLTPDSFATKPDDSNSQSPVSQQTYTDTVTSPHSDSDESQAPIKDVTEVSESESDSNTSEPPADYSSETDGGGNLPNLISNTGDETGTPNDDENVSGSETPQGDISLHSDQSDPYKDDDDLENSNAHDSDDSTTLMNDVNSNNPNAPKVDDGSDYSEILGDSDTDDSKTDDSGTKESNGDANDSNTPDIGDDNGDDDAKDSEILDDSDDMDDSGTEENNGDADDSNITNSDDDDSDDDADDSEILDGSDNMDDSGTEEGNSDADDSSTPDDGDDNGDDDADDSEILDGDADDLNIANSDDDDSDDDADDSEILVDSDNMDDSGTEENNGDTDDSSTPNGDDVADDSEILGDSDDMDDSEAAEDDGDEDDDDVSKDSDNFDDTLRQAEVSSINASDTTTTSTTASPSQTASPIFPGAVVHNAGPELFQKSACNCGLRFATKVVNGQTSSISKYPWNVGLINIGNFLFCGGTLINDRYIVTAAHCIINKKPDAVRVRMGVTGRKEDNAVVVDTKKLLPHAKYNSESYHKFDIGLIELKDPINFSDVIFPACLPPHNLNLINKEVIVTGWGKNNYSGEVQDFLQEVNVTVHSTGDCRDLSLYEKDKVHKKILCASAPGKDACQGDSGGPMIYQHQETMLLVGIVSWGIGCAQAKYPGIYTSITGFGHWITNKIRGDKTCLPSYPKPFKKNNKNRGEAGGMISDGAVDDFLPTWIQPNDASNSKTTQTKKTQITNPNQENSNSEEEEVKEKTKKRKKKKKKKKGEGNKTAHNKDDTGIRGNVQETESSEESPNNRKKGGVNKKEGQNSDGSHNTQDDDGHEGNPGKDNNHKRNHVKDDVAGGVTHANDDSGNADSELEDWSILPIAIKAIADSISRDKQD